MFTISSPAYERLSEMLANRPDDVAARIYVDQGRARIRPGRLRQGDQVIEHDGRTVLLIDGATAQRLNRRRLGIRDTAAGPRLRLHRIKPKDPA